MAPRAIAKRSPLQTMGALRSSLLHKSTVERERETRVSSPTGDARCQPAPGSVRAWATRLRLPTLGPPAFLSKQTHRFSFFALPPPFFPFFASGRHDRGLKNNTTQEDPSVQKGYDLPPPRAGFFGLSRKAKGRSKPGISSLLSV